MKNFSWRLGLVGAVLVLAVIFFLPTVDYYSKNQGKQVFDRADTIWPHKVINLGLDLQGGMHLVLEVEVEKAVMAYAERRTHDLRDELRSEKIKYTNLERVEGSDKITLKLLGGDADFQFDELAPKEFPELEITSKVTQGEDTVIVMELPAAEKERIKASAVDQALEVIRTRVDSMGLEEPDIRKQGERRILIQLPGEEDTERAKKRLGETAQLEFKLVDDSGNLAEAIEGNVPRGSEILIHEITNQQTGVTKKEKILVKKKALLTGDYITEAVVRFDNQYGTPYVGIKLDKKGGRIFERLTEKYKGERLAIVLDGVVKSAPVIKSKISGGEAIIEGNFTPEEARDLAIVLRTALPAPVKILEERTVGPSLGHDSIRMGVTSMILGAVLVVIFMVIYYGVAGLIADLALVLNILLIGAGLAAFGATLTLPGIAGIILTIGMAVDANVLIFERIREEMRLGKTSSSAVEAGYAKAMITILDANVTTFVAALVLFQFGTGPVKGFAVTLSLGIVCSFFTAVVVTRIVFDYLLYYKRVKKLSI